MGEGKLAKIAPQWIAGDIGDDHLLAKVSRGSAGTHRRTNLASVDGVGISLRQAGCSTVPQLLAVRIEQQDRCEDIAGLLFHKPAQVIKYLSKRVAPGHHLEQAFLAREQSFGPLAVRNVGNRADELNLA
jgi:hypothetical protein